MSHSINRINAFNIASFLVDVFSLVAIIHQLTTRIHTHANILNLPPLTAHIRLFFANKSSKVLDTCRAAQNDSTRSNYRLWSYDINCCKMCLRVLACRPGHTKFLFSGQKKFEISGHFSRHQSHKNAFLVILGAYNFGTFRAEAKITIRRHEVVYRLSSERKMIDLEWSLHTILMLKSGTRLLSLCPVLLTHK